MTTEWTPEAAEKLRSFLAEPSRTLSAGLGTTTSPCSIAAINLALTGALKGDVPECMSTVIGEWILGVQDIMPSEIRNSAEWRSLLPAAAGRRRDSKTDSKRAAVLHKWMWETVLPDVAGIADRNGSGNEWRAMLVEKTPASAHRAMNAADRAGSLPLSSAASAVLYAEYTGPGPDPEKPEAESRAAAVYTTLAAEHAADAIAGDETPNERPGSAEPPREDARTRTMAAWTRWSPTTVLARMIACGRPHTAPA